MNGWLPWAPLAAAILHIFEEFVYPGGFPEWYRRYRSEPSRITRRFLIIINGALIVACINIGLLGQTKVGAGYWMVITAVLCSNGFWHLWATCKSREYSPGVATGILIYVPLAGYGYFQLVNSGLASLPTTLIAGAVGGSYHLWSALFHRPSTER